MAEVNKAKYMAELAAYQQTDAYKSFLKRKQQGMAYSLSYTRLRVHYHSFLFLSLSLLSLLFIFLFTFVFYHYLINGSI